MAAKSRIELIKFGNETFAALVRIGGEYFHVVLSTMIHGERQDISVDISKEDWDAVGVEMAKMLEMQ